MERPLLNLNLQKRSICNKILSRIKNSYIRSEIRYIKRLKAKHPDLFDEADEPGTLLYERLKKAHPEHFKNEIAAEIEAKKAKDAATKVNILAVFLSCCNNAIAKATIAEAPNTNNT